MFSRARFLAARAPPAAALNQSRVRAGLIAEHSKLSAALGEGDASRGPSPEHVRESLPGEEHDASLFGADIQDPDMSGLDLDGSLFNSIHQDDVLQTTANSSLDKSTSRRKRTQRQKRRRLEVDSEPTIKADTIKRQLADPSDLVRTFKPVRHRADSHGADSARDVYSAPMLGAEHMAPELLRLFQDILPASLDERGAPDRCTHAPRRTRARNIQCTFAQRLTLSRYVQMTRARPSGHARRAADRARRRRRRTWSERGRTRRWTRQSISVRSPQLLTTPAHHVCHARGRSLGWPDARHVAGYDCVSSVDHMT